ETVTRQSKRWIIRKALQKIVRRRTFLHSFRRSDRMAANHFVRLLTITARTHCLDQNLFCRHEWQLSIQALADSRDMHFEPARDVVHEKQDRIRSKECFRNYKAAVGTVV